MSIPSLLILFLLIAPLAHSYTVITRFGKRIEGAIVTEQTSTIMIKDPHGVLISFKKEALDWNAMNRENAPQANTQMKHDRPPREQEPSLVEVARRSKEERTGKARKLTMEDLVDAPVLSVIGSDLPVSARTKEEQAPDESRWDARLTALKKEVNRLRERRVTVEASCEQSKRKQFQERTTGHDRPSSLMSTYRETTECSRLKEIETQLEEAETRLEEAREEGRRAGVSWQTLE